MKIAISAAGATPEAEVDPRFGRCPQFIVADTDTGVFETLENPGLMASGGAGIAAAQMIAGQGVNAMLTGNCGPNAYGVLSAAGIEVVTGVSGKIADAVAAYQKGDLRASPQANVSDHYGMGGGGAGGGRGGGGGRGMGGGMGRGRNI